MIAVECQRVDCGETADISREADWSSWGGGVDPFAGLGYGATIVVALPEGWAVDYVGADEVIHCPEHAGT